MTVGLPFYNAQETLSDSIRSVFAQTMTDWELILTDDGSTDGSLDIARSVGDRRVRVVSDGRNLGLAARLNQVVHLAGGKYLARMDADDLMHPDRFALQAEFLDRNPAVDVVGTGVYLLDGNGLPVGRRLVSPTNPTARQVLSRGGLSHATIMGRTDWFRRNPYDPAYRRSQDFELWCRTCGQSRFATLPGYLYYCSEHASFSLPKYVKGTLSHARVQWEYGIRRIGLLACCVLYTKELLKVPVYAGAVALRAHGRLITRRSTPLSPSEIEHVSADMARIRATPLPRRPRAPSGASGRPGV